jgi:hypothetical protein
MTVTTPGVEGVIKTDVLGRKRTPAARRASLLDEFDKSGLSARKYSELIGVKYQTLATWLQKRRKTQVSVRASDTVKWLEAVVEQAHPSATSASSSVVLRWEGGARMEINDTKQIPMAAALIRALAQPC